MHCRISLRRACNPCGYTMKMNSRYHRLLIYDIMLTTKTDGMGPFKLMKGYDVFIKIDLIAEQINDKYL